jgi:hypothetical protein
VRLEKLTVAQKVAKINKNDTKGEQIGYVLLIIGEVACKWTICHVSDL